MSNNRAIAVAEAVRTAAFVVFSSSAAWALAWSVSLISVDDELSGLAFRLLASILGGALIGVGYLRTDSHATPAMKPAMRRVLGWALAWLIGSIWLWLIYYLNVLSCGGFGSSSPMEQCVSDARGSWILALAGGAVGGLIFGINDWMSVRGYLRFSRLLVPAAIAGWIAAWIILAKAGAELALFHYYDESNPGFERSIVLSGAIAGAAAAIPSGIVAGLLGGIAMKSAQASDAASSTSQQAQ